MRHRVHIFGAPSGADDGRVSFITSGKNAIDIFGKISNAECQRVNLQPWDFKFFPLRAGIFCFFRFLGRNLSDNGVLDDQVHGRRALALLGPGSKTDDCVQIISWPTKTHPG